MHGYVQLQKDKGSGHGWKQKSHSALEIHDTL